jgi:hypothetical protein
MSIRELTDRELDAVCGGGTRQRANRVKQLAVVVLSKDTNIIQSVNNTGEIEIET